MNKEKFTLRAESVCYLLNHITEYFWRNTVEALAVGDNAYATHLYGTWREENALVLRGKEALRARFSAEEHDCVKRPPTAVRC